jgi:hypothetical protein
MKVLAWILVALVAFMVAALLEIKISLKRQRCRCLKPWQQQVEATLNETATCSSCGKLIED